MLRDRIQKYILAAWYPDPQFNKNLIAKLLWIVMVILSYFYQLIIKLRHYLYNKNILKSFKINVPVVIVGNITVGGNGKTPVVISLVKLLQDSGYTPGVVLRGYGINKKTINSQITIVNQDSLVDQCGDEAMLIYNNTGCAVVASSDRILAAKFLVDNNLCNIIVSDDGLQHYRLQRDIEICLVDDDRRFGNNYLLPAGPLREPLRRLDSVGYILTKISEDKCINIEEIKNNKNFLFTLSGSWFANLKTKQQYSAAQLSGILLKYNVFVYSGIANNNSFIELLSALFLPFRFNLNKDNVHGFPDHYNYTATDLSILNNNNNMLLTTEKDAVKIIGLEKEINNFDHIFYLKVSADLPVEFIGEFLEAVKIKKLNLK